MSGITVRTASDARPFWQLAAKASELEDTPSVRALGYPPHITLARYPEIPPALLFKGLSAFEGVKALSLTFDRIGIFDIEPIVLWLSPRHDRRLIDLHEKVHDIIVPLLCDAHYRPHQWTPHLTLAMAIPADRRTRALELAAQPFEPFTVTFDAAECVSWPPVRVMRSLPLRT